MPAWNAAKCCIPVIQADPPSLSLPALDIHRIHASLLLPLLLVEQEPLPDQLPLLLGMLARRRGGRRPAIANRLVLPPDNRSLGLPLVADLKTSHSYLELVPRHQNGISDFHPVDEGPVP